MTVKIKFMVSLFLSRTISLYELMMATIPPPALRRSHHSNHNKMVELDKQLGFFPSRFQQIALSSCDVGLIFTVISRLIVRHPDISHAPANIFLLEF